MHIHIHKSNGHKAHEVQNCLINLNPDAESKIREDR